MDTACLIIMHFVTCLILLPAYNGIKWEPNRINRNQLGLRRRFLARCAKISQVGPEW